MTGIRLENVSCHFGTVAAVDRLTLQIHPNEFFTLLGPSGCGKTTTLRIIAGLEENQGGKVYIGDRVVSDPQRGIYLPPEQRSIGMVFQSYAIWPHMTVFENVAYPLRVRRYPRSGIRERVNSILKMMDLSALAERPATALSGGQQQRVAIARALVSQPSVVLMDEPLSNLDVKLRESMRKELRALQKRLGITTVYVTHDQDEAMELSDRIAVMHAGRLLQVGTPEDIYLRPMNRTVAAFLGSPALLSAVVREIVPGSPRMFHVEGDGWAGWCRGHDAITAGENVTVVVRPEFVQLSRTEPTLHKEATVWLGRVGDIRFRGGKRLVEVHFLNTVIDINVSVNDVYAKGEAVFLYCPADHMWVVADRHDAVAHRHDTVTHAPIHEVLSKGV